MTPIDCLSLLCLRWTSAAGVAAINKQLLSRPPRFAVCFTLTEALWPQGALFRLNRLSEPGESRNDALQPEAKLKRCFPNKQNNVWSRPNHRSSSCQLIAGEQRAEAATVRLSS